MSSKTSTYQATRSFATYVAGDCVSVAGGQMVNLPTERGEELLAAGYVVAGSKATTKENAKVAPGRVVSDLVPDPTDITDAEKLGVRDPVTGRAYEDPSTRRAREDARDAGDTIVQADSAGETHEGEKNETTDANQEPVVNDPEGTHTDPADDGEAAKGSATTGKRDVSKGPKAASKPIKTGQTTAKRKPRASGQGKVGAKDPDITAEDRSTVGDTPPTVEPTGPNRDEPNAEHPSPGTVDTPDPAGS